ncbi:MAG: hypothetical protein H7099_04475 [Gemmatimonadaceae bacterium]|nr:hypothetical protein [Gemmatimonadaceae bacterium]
MDEYSRAAIYNYTMPIHRRLVPILFAASLAAMSPMRAQSVQNAATDLAQRWSATATAPRCTRAKALTHIERMQAAFDCTWPAPRTPAGGSLTGVIQSQSGFTIVTWLRPTLDSADAVRVRDSLGTSLEKIGFRTTPCGPDGSDAVALWVSREAAVHVARVAAPNGSPRLQIIATTDLANTPDIRCLSR